MTPADRPELRAQAWELSGGRCEWPRCVLPAEELAHLNSVGMGGNPDGSRETIEDVMAACYNHARMTDGLYSLGGRQAYKRDHAHLGVDLDATPRHMVAAVRALALRNHLAGTRSYAA